jgi:hypothetical protein
MIYAEVDERHKGLWLKIPVEKIGGRRLFHCRTEKMLGRPGYPSSSWGKPLAANHYAPKMASYAPRRPTPALHSRPAHVIRPPLPPTRLATPGLGLCGGGPAPRGKRTNRRRGEAGQVVTSIVGGAPEGSNRLVGGGERRDREGTEGEGPGAARAALPEPEPEPGAPRASPGA